MEINSPLRVLQVIPSISLVYGGPSQMVLGLSAALANLGVEVTIITTDANGDEGQAPLAVPLATPLHQEGYEIIYFRCNLRRYKFSLALWQWLWRNAHRYDVVHIHALFSPVSTGAAAIARHRHLPYILRPLGTLDPVDLQKKRYLKQLYGWLWERGNLQGAAAVHFTSQQEAATAYRFGVQTTDVVLPLGVEPPPHLDLLMEEDEGVTGDEGGTGRYRAVQGGIEDEGGTGRYRAVEGGTGDEGGTGRYREVQGGTEGGGSFSVVGGEEGSKDGGEDGEDGEDGSEGMREQGVVRSPNSSFNPLILFLSRIDRKKGLDLLIPALEELLAEGWKFHFILAGSNPQDRHYEAQIKAQIIGSPLGKSTIIPGFVTGQYKRQLLQQADLLVLPSYYENFGIAVAEAMIVGTPVLISDQVQIWQEILEAEAGWVCSCDRSSLLTQLRAALGDDLNRQKRGSNAQRYAWQNYRWSAIAQRTQQLYWSIARISP